MVTLAQITMNAGDDIPGSTIKYNLKKNAEKFGAVIVVDGNLTDEAREFYKQFPNVMAIDSPWEDSYIKQYEKFAHQLLEGEWCLYLDCDEIPSEELIEACQDSRSFNFINKGDYVHLIKIPCVLHIKDGDKYYPVEPSPKKDFTNQWTKNILFRKNDGLHFRHFGSHVIPENTSKRYHYLDKPYYHMKSLESFAYNDVWQAFLSPEGQGYTPVEAAQFKMFTKQYKTTAEFKKATKEGTWPVSLQMFARKKSHVFDRPISRLAWVYYLLEDHIDVWSDAEMRNWETGGPMTWDHVKKFVLGKESMELLSENKKMERCIELTD